MAIPSDGSLAPITCANCGKTFDGMMPKCEIMESETVTVLAWSHPNPEVCPKCGQWHRFKIINLKGFAVDFIATKDAGEAKTQSQTKKVM